MVKVQNLACLPIRAKASYQCPFYGTLKHWWEAGTQNRTITAVRNELKTPITVITIKISNCSCRDILTPDVSTS